MHELKVKFLTNIRKKLQKILLTSYFKFTAVQIEAT